MRDSPDFIPTNPIKTPPPPPPHSARRLLRAALTTLALLAGLGAPETRAAISNVTAAQMPDIGNGALNVASFHIGKYEVTWGEWQTVRSWAAANGYDIGSVGAGSGNDHPVRDVNWYHVVKVGNGAAFPAVTVNPAAGWSFTGWTPAAPSTVARCWRFRCRTPRPCLMSACACSAAPTSSTGACRSSRSQGPPPGACGINSTARRPISHSSKWRRS